MRERALAFGRVQARGRQAGDRRLFFFRQAPGWKQDGVGAQNERRGPVTLLGLWAWRCLLGFCRTWESGGRGNSVCGRGGFPGDSGVWAVAAFRFGGGERRSRVESVSGPGWLTQLGFLPLYNSHSLSVECRPGPVYRVHCQCHCRSPGVYQSRCQPATRASCRGRHARGSLILLLIIERRRVPVVTQYRLRQALVSPGGLVNIWKLASESPLEPDSRRRAGEGNGACHKLNARPRGHSGESH